MPSHQIRNRSVRRATRKLSTIYNASGDTFSQMAQQQAGIKRTILQTLPIGELPGWESRLVLLEYPPGFAAPTHKHPVAATGFVVEGDVVSKWEGGKTERYTAGDSFVDLGEAVHVQSENASKTAWLRMLLSYVIKIGEPNVVML